MLQDLYTACQETGFFFAYNTEIEDGDMQRMSASSRLPASISICLSISGELACKHGSM